MKIEYSKDVDALYIRLDESPVVESEEIQPGIVLDYNAKSEAIGIEIRGIKKRVPGVDLKKLQFETI